LLNCKLDLVLNVSLLLLLENRGFFESLLVQLSEVNYLVLVTEGKQLCNLHQDVVLGELAPGSPDEKWNTALRNASKQAIHEVLGLVDSE